LRSNFKVINNSFSFRCQSALKLAYSSYESTKVLTNTGKESSPIIIQHGLLGSRRNWNSLGKAIHAKTGRKASYYLKY
jgi:hypothetical protein